MKRHFLSFLFASVFLVSLSGCTENTTVTLDEIPIDMSLVTENLSLQELNDLSDGNAEVTYGPDKYKIGSVLTNTQLPDSIDGVFSTRKIFTAEDAVYALLSVRGIMQIDGTSFACTKIAEDHGENKVAFYLQQLYKGVAVEFGRFTVLASKNDGTPVSVWGYNKHVLNLDLDVEPQISEKEARKAVKLEGRTKIKEAQLVVYGTSSESNYCLAWKFTVFGQDLIYNKVVYIDAVTGNVISEHPTTMT